MPVEYQRALTGLKARYGVTASLDTKEFGGGVVTEPSLFLAIPPPPEDEENNYGQPTLGKMSVRIADLTVDGLLGDDSGVMEEVVKSREELRYSSVQKSVESKAKAKSAAGFSAKNSIKWLSSPPSQKKNKAKNKEKEEMEEKDEYSPRKYNSALAIRSPLRRLNGNELPMSSASIESRGSLEALSDLRGRIKSVESSLKDKRIRNFAGGGESAQKMKRDLDDIRERRVTMREWYDEKKGKGLGVGGGKTLFSSDFNFAKALVRNVMTADTGEAKVSGSKS